MTHDNLSLLKVILKAEPAARLYAHPRAGEIRRVPTFPHPDLPTAAIPRTPQPRPASAPADVVGAAARVRSTRP